MRNGGLCGDNPGMKPFAAAVLSALATASMLPAQEPTPDGVQPGINGFWEVVTAGGRFVARLDQIASVSEQEYLIDGAVRVFECTVDTAGGQTARFYHLESIAEGLPSTAGTAAVERLKRIANQAAGRTGVGDLDAVVTKHYPDTTHAKTSEYRVKNRATVSQIYDHVRKVWAEERGKGGENLLVIRNG